MSDRKLLTGSAPPSPHRRHFLKSSLQAVAATAAGGLSAGAARAVTAPADPTWMAAWELADAIRRGLLSPTQVTEHFVTRIERVNPSLLAFGSLDGRSARAQAERAEESLAKGMLKPLLGVPVAVAGNLPVRGLPFRAPDGTSRMAETDAIAVARLRAAGAIVLGTTIEPTPAGEGWAPESPRNPWSFRLNAGSGAAAAVAAGLVPIAVVSDIHGNTRLHAAGCGVIHAVTPWISSRSCEAWGVEAALGYAPPGYSPAAEYDAPCPLTGDVHDAMLLTQILSGIPGIDRVAREDEMPLLPGPDTVDLERIRFAWAGGFGAGANAETRRLATSIRQAVEKRIPSGALPELQPVGNFHPRGQSRFEHLFADHDILFVPVARGLGEASPLESPDMKNGHDEQWSAHLVSRSGAPSITLPCGTSDGLPAAIQLVSRPGDEQRLYRVAAMIARSNRPVPAAMTSSRRELAG
jgi:Asp-tRNA(Asn)/Glu-tRNA(Gln) amidotransferase A subunit family amidase